MKYPNVFHKMDTEESWWIEEVWHEIDANLKRHKMDPELHFVDIKTDWQISFQDECQGNPFTVCAVIEKKSGEMRLGASKRCKYGWEDGRVMSKKTRKAIKNRTKPFLYDPPKTEIGQKYALKRAVKLLLEEMLVCDMNNFVEYNLEREEGDQV